MAQFYKEFFQPKAIYKPVMTKEAIEADPNTWLGFYPHQTFLRVLSTLFEKFEVGDRSVWMYGAYGTGKSYAALVIQKLFTDTDERVAKYCADYKELINKELVKHLEKWRKQNVLVVYETGTDGVYTPQQLLVGIERAILKACKERGFKVPSLSGFERLSERIKEESERFFRKRDEIQGELVHLTPDITTYEEFVHRCEKENGKYAEGLLQDAERVLEHDNIFLMPGAEQVLDWIDEIRKVNGIGKIVFVWDEFSSYIEHAKSDLKTFEKLAEAKAQQCGFHFVPVTHMELDAFLAAGSESAKKANDRYTFCPLQIPANQVFYLGASAFERPKEKEWAMEADHLWSVVSPVVTSYMAKHLPKSEAVEPQDFKVILPLHPMCAYLLRHMSELVGSNTRSFFDYLRVTNGQSEFQKFLEEGGPAVANHQYLMVDYLWRYFIERDDLGRDGAVQEIETEFNAKKAAIKFADGSPEERVYKAVLLYSLMEKKAGKGVQELLAPTVENIEQAFFGDGAVVNVRSILQGLEEKHCFSIIGDRVMPLISGVKVDPTKFRDNFTGLAANDVAVDIQRKIDLFGDPSRYDVRAYHGVDFKPSDVKNRPDYGESSNGLKQGNKILVNCLLARDHAGTIAIPEKAKQMAKQFAGLRMVFVYFSNISFCEENKAMWEDYIMLRAQADNATDQGLRGAYESRAKAILEKWKQRITAGTAEITMLVPADNASDQPIVEQGLTWATLKTKLNEQKKRWFYLSPDDYALGNLTILNNKPVGLKTWALAGLTGSGVGASSGHVQKLKTVKGVQFDEAWFDANPNNELTKIKEFFDKKRQNTVGAGNTCSIRKAYLELRRAPYGFEKNAFSAFVLGFTLKTWLSKKLQWTDGRISQSLDPDALAEIIEKVVQDDGEGKIKDEKLICRLSQEEKTFTAKISEIFGLSTDSSATPESVLASVGERVRTQTGNIPLWVLPPYVKSLGTETAETNICKVIGLLCEVLKMSSKSKDGSKTDKIKEIGELFLKNEGLAEAIGRYITPDVFTTAFDQYLDGKAPNLIKFAEDAGDLGGEYRKSVLARFSTDASWLWNETDVSEAVKDIENQYRFVLSVQSMFAVSSWLNFAAAQEKLLKAMTEDNKISLAVLAATYPFVSELAVQVKDPKIQGDALAALCLTMDTQKETINSLFREPSKSKPIEILVANLGGDAAEITSAEWKEILDARQGGAELNENDFRDAMWNAIKSYREKSEGYKLLKLWNDATGTDGPDSWSDANGLPCDVLFAEEAEARRVLGVLRDLDEASSERIKAACNSLKKAKMADAAQQGKNFLSRYLPKRYAKLAVKPGDLADWFSKHLGAKPNLWWNNPAREDEVMQFVKHNYDAGFRPDVESKIKKMSDAEAKAELLKLVALIPDAGIALMN